LARRERLEHFLADRAHLDALDQRLDHRQRDVGLEQRDAHFAQRFANVLLGQPAAAAQAFDGAGQALGQGFEHEWGLRNAAKNWPRSIAPAPWHTPGMTLAFIAALTYLLAAGLLARDVARNIHGRAWLLPALLALA